MNITIPRPSLPDGIAEAIDKQELALFLGAGVSVATGCYTWQVLAQNLVSAATQHNLLDYANAEQIRNFDNNKKIIGIIESIFKKNGEHDKFKDILVTNIERSDNKHSLNIFKNLQSFLALNVTTNADTRYDTFFPDKTKILKSIQSKISKLHTDYLYKVHGCATDFDTLIFTVNQYLNGYRQNSPLHDFFKELFSSKTVLFIGYSLSEFELLQYIIPQSKTGSQRRHFWLKDYFYQNGLEILEYEKQYYLENFSIEIVPYFKDKFGWDELKNVIEEWAVTIPKKSNFISSNFLEIDKAVSNGTNIEEIIYKANNNKSFEEYLFRKLSNTDNIIPWFKALKVSDLLSINSHPEPLPEKDGKHILVKADFWWPLFFLENLAAHNQLLKDKEISSYIISKINEILEIQKKYEYRNFRSDRSLITLLACLPIEHMLPANIENLSEIIDSDMGGSASEVKDKLAPHIINSNRPDLIRELLSQILRYKVRDRENYFGEGTYKEFDSILTDYWFREIIQDNRSLLIDQYPPITQTISQAAIESILAEDNKQFAWYKIKTIEDNNEHRYPNVRDYEYILSDLLRDSILSLPDSEKRPLIEAYLMHEHEYFIRLAIYLIGQSYKNFSELFWRHFSEINPITDEKLRWALHHEIFELVKTNAEIIDNESIEKLITWIEGIEIDDYTEEAKARGPEWLKKRKAYDKLEWYKEALQKSASLQIQQKIKENEAICDWERAIPAGHFSGSVGPATIVHDESPKKSEELSKMSIPEVAKYLIEFGLVNEHNPDKPNSSGLARVLEINVKNRLQEYSSQIIEFQDVPYYYLQRLLWAFQSSWRDGKPLSWVNIIQFIEHKILPSDFWSNIIIEDNHANEQAALAGAIIGLINDGLNDRDNKFPVALLPQSQSIILKYIEKFPYNIDLSTLSINDYINTVPGKVFEAAIKVWWAIENEIKKGNNLENRILPEFESRLNSNNSPSEFYYCLGQGFRGFWYYNRDWTEKHIDYIFSKSNSNKLTLAFNGFFDTVPAVYTDIYEYFKEKGLFNLAIIQIGRLDERAKEALAHQILLGGIESDENIKETTSTIRELIANADSHTLSRTCWLFWHYISEGNKKVFPYMLYTWHLINKRLNSISDSEKDNITTYLLRWPELIDSWSAEIPGLIENTMDHLLRQRSVDYIIEAFYKHYNNSQNLVIESFKGILNKKHFPTYPTDKLISLVETMYTDGHKSEANEICNAYMEAGIYYLKPLWEKYNNVHK